MSTSRLFPLTLGIMLLAALFFVFGCKKDETPPRPSGPTAAQIQQVLERAKGIAKEIHYDVIEELEENARQGILEYVDKHAQLTSSVFILDKNKRLFTSVGEATQIGELLMDFEWIKPQVKGPVGGRIIALVPLSENGQRTPDGYVIHLEYAPSPPPTKK